MLSILRYCLAQNIKDIMIGSVAQGLVNNHGSRRPDADG
jgi:hypothetical protein